MPTASIVLRDRHDRDGSRFLGASRRPDGAIVIEGHDLGPGVEEAWGEGLREYEWTWTIAPDAIPAMVAALGGGEDDAPLAVLAAWAKRHPGSDPGGHLREAGVPVGFWSRVGD
jgi:hypothetical protein